jgi:hypothetical protein
MATLTGLMIALPGALTLRVPQQRDLTRFARLELRSNVLRTRQQSWRP